MTAHQQEAAAIVLKQPYVDSFMSSIGASNSQRGPEHRTALHPAQAAQRTGPTWT
jgi:hypothetical protein